MISKGNTDIFIQVKTSFSNCEIEGRERGYYYTVQGLTYENIRTVSPSIHIISGLGNLA
jgi:hypothetical protein